MIRYGIIQLSDLQFGSKHRFGSPSNLASHLIRDIQYMVGKYQFYPIYLLLTGDITESANLNEFSEAEKVIKLICNGISIDKNSVLSVPGNHDINWKLSEVSKEVGDPNLKYNNYNKFAKSTCNKYSQVNEEIYNMYSDHRLGIEFLFLNSCEKEDHTCHIGYIDKDKLVNSIIKHSSLDDREYTKICLAHHRVELNHNNHKSVVENSYEIQSILFENHYNIILTGHIHENRCQLIQQDKNNIIFSGAGSAGVDSSQRIDGMQNQYSIHVLDSYNKKYETYWRAYSPNKKTRFGLGAWTEDNSVEVNPNCFELPNIVDFDSFSSLSMEDPLLIEKLGIKRNPFTFNNAEKISSDQIIKLFVASEERNKSAVRLTGDAIIRGSRGSGKTMLLRYLKIFGDESFDNSFSNKRVSESFPVLVNLSSIHSSIWKSDINALIESADKLIYESVLNSLEEKNRKLNSLEFKSALFKMKQRLSNLDNQEGNAVSKLGIAIVENMSSYFTHILLLIDEVAPIFPKEFFSGQENGFQRWMNSIRNSGPFFTRIAVYPNDFSDILNEERFGSIVNLDYNVKNYDEYKTYRKYCIELVNKYLDLVSIDKVKPTEISEILELNAQNEDDGFEQLLYASDGSSRRFSTLMDKCITSTKFVKGKPLNKDIVLEIIKDFSNNLLESYNPSERELAQSLAKVCKRQITYRFRVPGLTSLITSLHAKSEELNIVKLTEVGLGRRGTTYEFTYPYCLLMDIQTHYFKETRKVCPSRDSYNGEWITTVTTIPKEQVDCLNQESRFKGTITEIDEDCVIIIDEANREYLSDKVDIDYKVGEKVSFIFVNNVASDLKLGN